MAKKPTKRAAPGKGKDKDKDKECRGVLEEYFEKTAEMLSAQEDLCHEAVRKIKAKDYDRHDLRQDWRKSFDRTVEYSRMATRAWIDYTVSCRWWGPFGTDSKI